MAKSTHNLILFQLLWLIGFAAAGIATLAALGQFLALFRERPPTPAALP
jgi:hypothetical protein